MTSPACSWPTADTLRLLIGQAQVIGPPAAGPAFGRRAFRFDVRLAPADGGTLDAPARRMAVGRRQATEVAHVKAAVPVEMALKDGTHATEG